jgi:hypothetical protein
VGVGKIRAGQRVFDLISGKTTFIYRDNAGEWGIEPEYKVFLGKWAKRSIEE